MANPKDIYTDGVELICPAVYISDSAAEALSHVVTELSLQVDEVANAVERAYDAYGDDSELPASIDYFSMLDEEDES